MKENIFNVTELNESELKNVEGGGIVLTAFLIGVGVGAIWALLDK